MKIELTIDDINATVVLIAIKGKTYQLLIPREDTKCLLTFIAGLTKGLKVLDDKELPVELG